MGAQNTPHTKYVKQLTVGTLSVTQLLIWNKKAVLFLDFMPY